MDDTIISGSSVGKRLAGLRKKEALKILYDGVLVPVTCTIQIGRDSTNHICVEDRMVSRSHALIQKIKKEYFIKDQGSTNGTWVNGKKVPSGKYMRIHAGDTIRVGRTDILVR
jgi:pSer/pThr/pTyr-binding forkhead associated (FHA) protein